MFLKDKWESGYGCKNCGHTRFQVRKDYSRTCNICSKTESATANTLFHKVKFGIRKAFFICFEMSTTTKSLSASYMAARYGVSENTARMFMHKVREGMKSGGAYPMDGNVHVDEFVVSYRLNRSQNKATVFNILIKRMVQADKIYHAQIICP